LQRRDTGLIAVKLRGSSPPGGQPSSNWRHS
jgi:hypothetical protein